MLKAFEQNAPPDVVAHRRAVEGTRQKDKSRSRRFCRDRAQEENTQSGGASPEKDQMFTSKPEEVDKFAELMMKAVDAADRCPTPRECLPSVFASLQRGMRLAQCVCNGRSVVQAVEGQLGNLTLSVAMALHRLWSLGYNTAQLRACNQAMKEMLMRAN